MKRIYALICTLILLFSFGGCEKENTDNENSAVVADYANEITESQAESLVRAYFNTSMAQNVLAEEVGANEIRYLEVASIEEGGGLLGVEYCFYVSGNFFDYDSFGTLDGQYKFRWCIGVEEDGDVRAASNITIS